MKCQKCNVEVPAGDEHDYQGKTFCEDCFLDANKPPRACNDPRGNNSTNK